LLALGYFTVWTTLGAAMYPVSVAVAVVAQHLPIGSRAGPLAVGVLILITGLLQLTDWNARHVACCRELSGARTSMAVATTPWRQGLDLGVHCACSSTLPMATLLLAGSMSLTAMWVVTAAITVERLAPDAPRVARIFGAVTIPASLIFVVRTIVQS
jgi:predicted metal-binding membrane protein